MQMDFKPGYDRVSSGVSSEKGIMDYGLMYRVFGPSASERVGNWNKQSGSNIIDIYTAGGFSVDNLNFTGSVLGIIGYRTNLFGVPTSVEAGYRALRVNVVKSVVATDVTLNVPFVGLTGYW